MFVIDYQQEYHLGVQLRKVVLKLRREWLMWTPMVHRKWGLLSSE
jgi:hypothetical protein